MLLEALRYSRIGLSIIPIQPKGKRPLIPWEEYQRTRASQECIRNWWTKWPDANVGIVTGPISGVGIIDLDGPEGIQEGLSLGLKSNVISATGDGKHLWYKWVEGLRNSAKKISPHIDVRGEGGYVLAPLSMHPNGKRYTWLNPLSVVGELQDFPMDVLNVAVESKVESKPKLRGNIADALKEMTVGNRDYTIFRICSLLRADGYSEDDARVLLTPHVLAAGKTVEQLQDKIDNVWQRYQSNKGETMGQTSTTDSLKFRTLDNSREEYRKRKDQRAVIEYSTGFPKLDALVGGYQRSEIFTVAALPGTGKTNYAIATSVSLCRAGKRVIFLSTEMSFDRIWDRFIAASGDTRLLETGQFAVCDEFTPDIPRIESALRENVPDIFIFDHINHISDDHSVLGDFMRHLKGLARKFNIPGIVMAELNRTADYRENGKVVPPRMSMIKGSGTLEQASAQILLLSELTVEPDQNTLIGVIDKNRYGDKGNISFKLMKNPYKFVEDQQ